MDISIENKKVANYFKFIKNWDVASKKDLISKLSNSIKSRPNDEFDFSSSFGAWEDERTADEIIEDIYSSRVNKTETESFE